MHIRISGATRPLALKKFFRRLRLPALGIAGSEDGSTPPDLVRETTDLIPGSHFRLIRRAGHLPFAEKPAEYAAILTDFLGSIGHLPSN